MKLLLNRILNRIQRTFISKRESRAGRKGSAAYWNAHMVPTDSFKSAENSLNLFHWRNAQYPGYIDLMPVSGQDGKVVLDYGCGPGNDIVGFAVYSNPGKLIAVDVSTTALSKAQERLSLHGKKAEFIHINEIDNNIPVPSESIDYIHTSGVLHHCANLNAVLKEFYRILKPDGEIAVMVYNYQSVWLHLYVSWIYQLKREKYKNLPVLEAFRRTTDGEGCPIAHCYTPYQFLDIMTKNRFKSTFCGSAISLTEMKCLEKRFEAIQDRRLPVEHRDFLSALTFDDRGIPHFKGSVAGIDACYKLIK